MEGQVLRAEEQARIVQNWGTVVVSAEGTSVAGGASMDEDESSGDEDVEGKEKIGPKYTGLKCMA